MATCWSPVYAVLRPDGNWSLMLVNRDESNSAHNSCGSSKTEKAKDGKVSTVR